MPGPTSYPQRPFRPPAGATEVLLVRHGASEAAVPGRPFPLIGGHGDPALAPEGSEQAERVGARLAHERVDAIYVTTLRRTVETAAPLAARLGITPQVEADLREVSLGAWEGGIFRQKVADGDPVAVQMFAEERWDVIPGAEPATAFAARVSTGLGHIVAANPGGRVVVVTHGGVIGQAMAQATGSRPFAFTGADNGSITTLVAVARRWVVRGFNDTAHLDSGRAGSSLDPDLDLPADASWFSA